MSQTVLETFKLELEQFNIDCWEDYPTGDSSRKRKLKIVGWFIESPPDQLSLIGIVKRRQELDQAVPRCTRTKSTALKKRVGGCACASWTLWLGTCVGRGDNSNSNSPVTRSRCAE
ncbi:hypothetical protein J6590_082554 [Homalodisca vitripennis]|nr:hypothetical protein J6590_082554 [Homalodisca vitripennis]